MLSAMLFSFKFPSGTWTRHVRCADWPDAIAKAKHAANERGAKWVEIHEVDGLGMRTFDCVDGKWEEINA